MIDFYIIIVDMEQPGRRGVVVFRDDNDDVAKFESISQIQSLHEQHPLRVFQWWAFNIATGESFAV